MKTMAAGPFSQAKDSINSTDKNAKCIKASILHFAFYPFDSLETIPQLYILRKRFISQRQKNSNGQIYERTQRSVRKSTFYDTWPPL